MARIRIAPPCNPHQISYSREAEALFFYLDMHPEARNARRALMPASVVTASAHHRPTSSPFPRLPHPTG